MFGHYDEVFSTKKLNLSHNLPIFKVSKLIGLINCFKYWQVRYYSFLCISINKDT